MKPMLSVLNRQHTERVPYWFMRQAGRYLPEYLEIRGRAENFLDLVYSPGLASEITMQPVRRFGTDGAILFSDILVIPDSIGQKVNFIEGTGPVLEPLESRKDIEILDIRRSDKNIQLVYEAASQVSEKLISEGYDETSLIGFAGSPWTLACYMIEGKGSKDFIRAKLWSYQDPESFKDLIEKLEEAVIAILSAQISAGAEIVQLFDSWAGVLDSSQFHKWVISPARRIITELRQEYPHVRFIGFPKGAGQLYQKYIYETGIDAVSLDSSVSPHWAAACLQPETVIQGNLDPVCLLAGGDALILETERILAKLGKGPFIFNLGHGIDRHTPLENVSKLCEIIRSWK